MLSHVCERWIKCLANYWYICILIYFIYVLKFEVGIYESIW